MSDREDLGALVTTPGDIKEEIDAADAEARALDNAIAASPARKEFKDVWAASFAEWRKFYDAHKNLADRLWTGDYPVAREYRRRIEDWSLAFAREAWEPHPAASPAATAAPIARSEAPRQEPTSVDRDPEGSYSLRTVLLVGAGALVLGGLIVHELED